MVILRVTSGLFAGGKLLHAPPLLESHDQSLWQIPGLRLQVSCDGPSPSQAMGSSSGLKPSCCLFLGQSCWGRLVSQVPVFPLHLWVPCRLWASVGGTRRLLRMGGLWFSHGIISASILGHLWGSRVMGEAMLGTITDGPSSGH